MRHQVLPCSLETGVFLEPTGQPWSWLTGIGLEFELQGLTGVTLLVWEKCCSRAWLHPFIKCLSLIMLLWPWKGEMGKGTLPFLPLQMSFLTYALIGKNECWNLSLLFFTPVNLCFYWSNCSNLIRRHVLFTVFQI